VVKEDSVGGHLKRHAGAYVGTAMVPVLGTGIGALIDAARKRSNLIKTADERVVSAKTAAALGGERMMSANLKPALRELAARSQQVTEFAQGQYVAGLLGIKNAVRLPNFVGFGPVRSQIAQNARKIRGIDQVRGEALKKALQPKREKLVKATKDIYQKEKREALAAMNSDSRDIQGWLGSQNYYSPLARKTKEVRSAYGLMLDQVKSRNSALTGRLNRVSELAARSGRIVEFGDGEADEAVIAALKAAASADESPAQRAMLLKRGLIQMVKGQLVINERGYDLMKKAGMPPKLTPEERREEIAGTEEKRLSRFNHGEHGGHGVEFARGDYALASAEGVLSKLNPAFSLARSRSLTLGGAKAAAARVPRRGTAEVKKLADAVRWHRNNRKLALKNLPHNVNSEQGIFEKIYEGYPY